MTKPPLSLPFLLLSLLITSLPLSVISQDQALSAAEQATLLEIKEELGNPDTLSNWNSSSNPCDWPEIGCTNNSVTAILLKDKNINEPVPQSICLFKNLLSLDVSYNNIPGGFPKVVYNCSKLQYLDLSQNYFVGPIPDDVYNLSPDLSYVDLSANNFTGDVPPSIGRLTALQTLFIHQNEFNGSFPKEIGNLVNLETLGMSYNEFVPMAIPDEFGQLKNLKYLWMTATNLIGEIPRSFNNLSSLEHLDLSTNSLNGSIPDKLLTFENLTNLFLFENRLSGEIPRPVKATKLVGFDLAMNSLTGSIPEEFGDLRSLELFSIFTNEFTGGVPKGIGLLPNLTDFKVFNNKLNGTLPPDLGTNKKLLGFEASNNHFTGQLPENLCAGGVLQGVVAFGNNLSGQVPESLGNCRTLRTVQLHSNMFSGGIPSGLWTTFNLSSLMLSDNLFTGQLPSELAWNLSRVEISNNRFSGEIPVGVGSWHNLVVFEASGNLLTGKIPEEITNLSQLTNLLLDGNQLSGQLPSGIYSLKSLTTLNLSRNELSGHISPQLGSLPVLTYLDLSENQFTGEIPPEIGNLKLTSLDLSSNKLSGQIPYQLNNLAYENSFVNNSNLCANSPVLDLPDCDNKLGSSKKLSTKLFIIIFALSVTVLLVTLIFSLFMIRDYRRRKCSDNIKTWKLTQFQELRFDETSILSRLTESNLIGSGGSGKVYKVPINEMGDYVAVKRIWNSQKLDFNLEKEFAAEVQILGTIRHSNIVKLLCCISSEDSKLLVYEYMENQSLDRWLHGGKRRLMTGSAPVNQCPLDWPKRLQIAIGAAQGLSYMHHDCSPPILHRDVKSSNILLDSEFKAKIADFGLAKMLAKDKDPHTMSGVAGSFGYIAPEYAYTTRVNEKIDIYSFGVVLLELVTGKVPNCEEEDTNLAEWAWHKYSQDAPVADALDPDIKDLRYLEDMTTVFKLGLICTSTLPSSRPSMKEVLQILRWCDVPQGYKKTGSEFDEAPLLGTITSVFKGSKKIRPEDDNCSVQSMNH